MSQNKKRPVEFVKSRTLKPIEERRNNAWKGDENYNIKKMKGLFHQWGSEIEEGENEVASLTVAIIEDENGQIHTPMASDVKFLDKQ